MYQQHFSFAELPFSIVPNSRFLYQSRRHKEALFHIQAGLGEGGGFAMLTGEVGTGKTTTAKYILNNLSKNACAGLILNPTFSSIEILEAICDEFDLTYPDQPTLKTLSQIIHQFLLDNYSKGINTFLVIDEAQLLSAEGLEQLRLLTNLETDTSKLLKVFLIGQPELQQKLNSPQLRQLAQRITGRYHLLPLNENETSDYVKFRLSLAGGCSDLFNAQSIKYIAHHTQGIPRLINLVCDASLIQAFNLGESQPSYQTVKQACDNVIAFQSGSLFNAPHAATGQAATSPRPLLLSLLVGGLLSIAAYIYTPSLISPWLEERVKANNPKTESLRITNEVFSPQVAQLLKQGRSSEVAVSELYELWGYRASVFDQLCLTEEEAVFHCERAKSTLDQLIDNDQPVVLELEIDGNDYYSVMIGFSTNEIQLLVGEKLITFEKQWLDSIWKGKYRFIWQSYWNETLEQGMKGPAIEKLNVALSSLLGEEAEIVGSEFDAELERKVKLFQRWQQLDVDGIAGEETLRALEKLYQVEAPKLERLENDINV